jgi:siroheme synthase
MRGVSGSVTFATAKLDAARSADWQTLARPGQTLALYMSAGSVGESAAQLMRHGLSGTTPAALVENGTTERQRVLHSRLAQVAADARDARIAAPAVLFVGPSVALGADLSWFGVAASYGNAVPGDGKAESQPTAAQL